MGRWDHPQRLHNLQYIDFDTEYEHDEIREGRVHWDAGNYTLSAGMVGGNVEIQIGQEHVFRAFNQTGDTITDGRAVYIIDAGDSKPRIALADSDTLTPVPDAVVVGLTTESIAHGSQGFVTTAGLVRGWNTNHLTEGEPAWLDTTPGALTTTRPDAPAAQVACGYCIYQHTNNGIFLVNVVAVPRMTGLSDTKTETPDTNGQVYQWITANSRFELQKAPMLPEITTPTAVADVGKIYTKSDNKLYFQDGAGVEHEVSLVT